MKPIIIANWKMNLTLDEAYNKVKQLDKVSYSSQLLLAPPTPYLAHFTKNFKNIEFVAQDISALNGFGAYTGEYSAEMIKSCRVNYAILGHSERRNVIGEHNKLIKQKALNCVGVKITPIICVGESLEARKNKNYKEFIAEQINESIPENAESVIIAYEPFWAIGSGLLPTIEEISEIFEFIKTSDNVSTIAKNARLVYGGSVNVQNYKDILAIDNNSGLMLGSASLKENELSTILN